VDETKSSLENVIESYVKGEPIVPINDIYNVFKTYWHARTTDGKPALAYSSMLVDTCEPYGEEANLASVTFDSYINPDEVSSKKSLEEALAKHDILKYNDKPFDEGGQYKTIAEGGKHNGMYFGNNKRIPRYAVPSKITDRREVEGKMTTVVTGYSFKHG
jgi:hypothetical protein